MRVRSTHRRGGNAFTLVELLAAIGIIAVLLALFLPVLKNTREQSMRLRCMDNMRHLLNAALLYTSDNDRVMPPPNWVGGPKHGWLYLDPPVKNPAQVTTGLLWPYLGGRRPPGNKPADWQQVFEPTLAVIYHCPLDQGPWTIGTTENLTSYLCNGAVVGYSMKRWPFPITRMRPDGVWFWEADERADYAWNDGASYPQEGESQRHASGCCVGRFDGAVDWWTHGEYLQEQAHKPSRLWCNPASPTGEQN